MKPNRRKQRRAEGRQRAADRRAERVEAERRERERRAQERRDRAYYGGRAPHCTHRRRERTHGHDGRLTPDERETVRMRNHPNPRIARMYRGGAYCMHRDAPWERHHKQGHRRHARAGRRTSTMTLALVALACEAGVAI